MNEEGNNLYFDPDSESDLDLSIREYDIVSSPNDFNVSSYFNFIESGSIVIPGFQRHYVWDIRKASKLIESILMGLPIPQIFLYEDGKNKFLVIDGQQRLMTIYYFMKGRFPKRDARAKIRSIFAEKGRLEASDLEDNTMFSQFKLSFSSGGVESPYAGLTYASLGELKATFDLRTIRNIMVKQVRPSEGYSSVFELFNRLNTGGINLSQQEIRMSLYYGPFVKLAVKMNENRDWRKILGSNPDQRQKDVEIILRMFALAEGYRNFKKPLTKFINEYCDRRKVFEDPDRAFESIFARFCGIAALLNRDIFLEQKSKRVSVPLLEALFVASAADAIAASDVSAVSGFTDEQVNLLRDHEDFEEYFSGKTTDVDSVKGRIELAKAELT